MERKKNGCEMVSIVKVRGDVNEKSMKSSRLPDQRSNGGPLLIFFFALALPLCSLPTQSDSKGKLDTARRLA